MTTPALPLGLTTELEAVNAMLDGIGTAPVNSLDTPSLDVSRALKVLRQVWREVLTMAWHFNQDYEYALPRDAEGGVVVPSNVLRIRPSDRWAKDFTQRDGRLWDREAKTFVIDPAITFDILWSIPFDGLPEAARNYITLRAVRRFQQRVLGDNYLGNVQEGDELQALAILYEAEGETAQLNIGNTYPMSRAIYRKTGL
jgi:hypothetical protein